jgi:carboxylesterase type B
VPVPVLVGYDRDELRSFLSREYPLAPARFNEIVERAYGAAADSVRSEYPLSAGTDPLYTLAAIRSDQMIACPSFLTADALAKHGPVSTFEFADRTAPPFRGLALRHPDPEGFEQGAGHTSELQYLFGYKAVAGQLTAGQVALADRMTKALAGIWPSAVSPGVAQLQQLGPSHDRAVTSGRTGYSEPEPMRSTCITVAFGASVLLGQQPCCRRH